METESGLDLFCYMSDQFEVALFSQPPNDPLYEDMFPVVRLSDAEAIIAKLRDALSETEAYHKRIVAAKDAEIERLKNDFADALDMKVGKGPTALSWQADRIEKQSAALKLARDALIGALSDDQPYINASKEALAAIDALDTNLEPTPPVSEDWKDANQARIEELELLAHNLGRGLIRWREREWPGTDQAHVVYREYPALKAIDAAMQEDKP